MHARLVLVEAGGNEDVDEKAITHTNRVTHESNEKSSQIRGISGPSQLPVELKRHH